MLVILNQKLVKSNLSHAKSTEDRSSIHVGAGSKPARLSVSLFIGSYRAGLEPAPTNR